MQLLLLFPSRDAVTTSTAYTITPFGFPGRGGETLKDSLTQVVATIPDHFSSTIHFSTQASITITMFFLSAGAALTLTTVVSTINTVHWTLALATSCLLSVR